MLSSRCPGLASPSHAHRQAGLRAGDRFLADACTSVLRRTPRRAPTRQALQLSRPVPQHGIRPTDLHGKPAHQGRQAPAHGLPQSGLAPGRTDTLRPDLLTVVASKSGLRPDIFGRISSCMANSHFLQRVIPEHRASAVPAIRVRVHEPERHGHAPFPAQNMAIPPLMCSVAPVT